MSQVVYKGPSSRADVSTEFVIEDADGKSYRLLKGRPSDDLPDALVTELLEGSPRLTGHRFAAAEGEDLGKLTVEALKDIAAEEGAYLGDATKKDDIVDAIEASREEA